MKLSREEKRKFRKIERILGAIRGKYPESSEKDNAWLRYDMVSGVLTERIKADKFIRIESILLEYGDEDIFVSDPVLELTWDGGSIVWVLLALEFLDDDFQDFFIISKKRTQENGEAYLLLIRGEKYDYVVAPRTKYVNDDYTMEITHKKNEEVEE